MKLEKNQVKFDKTNDAYDCRRGVEYLPRSLCAGSRGAVARQETRPPSWHVWWCARNLQIETKWVGPYSIWTVGKRVMRLSCVFLDDANDIQVCCKLKAKKEQRLGLGSSSRHESIMLQLESDGVGFLPKGEGGANNNSNKYNNCSVTLPARLLAIPTPAFVRLFSSGIFLQRLLRVDCPECN